MIVSFDVPVGQYSKRIQICQPYSMIQSMLSDGVDDKKQSTGLILDVQSYLNSGFHVSPLPPYRQISMAWPDIEKKEDETSEVEPGPKPQFENREFMKQLAPDVLARHAIREHPQTIALILINLEDQPTVEFVLKELSIDKRESVIDRMNRLIRANTVPPGVMKEIEEVFTSHLHESLSETERES